MSKVKLISHTVGVDGSTAEQLIAFTARVSNPANQMNNETAPRLLGYLINHKHWSPLEMVSMCVEVQTSRAIAAQILRHRSFSFQEFSQRYAEAVDFLEYPARRQDSKNRQNSVDDMDEGIKVWFSEAQKEVASLAFTRYKEALKFGVAKEQARFLLPLNTKTTMYMSGTARSWVHYLQLRTDKGTQLEHREIADEIRKIFVEQYPAISTALGWKH